MSLTRKIEISGAPPVHFSPAGLPRRTRSKSQAISVSNAQMTIGLTTAAGFASNVGIGILPPPRVVRFSLEMITEASVPIAFEDIPFKVSVTRDGQVILNSEEEHTPWKFSLQIDKERKQMSLNFTLNYSGLSIDQALEASSFFDALANGGTLRIRGRHPLTGGVLPIAVGSIGAGAYPNPDARIVDIIQQLAFIERKTGVSFSIPVSDITPEDANKIAATARILETGHAEYEAQPWISVSSVEQAKNVLDTFANGQPAAMAIQFTGQVVVIFGHHIILGPVTLFCNRTYITTEDLDDLRKQIQNANSESAIKIRLTPLENCPIEARYVNWLPEDEAEAIKQLPMYQRNNVTLDEELWNLPNTDIAAAVSLLKSWYDEDAEEQKASWDLLKNALERDRLSDRKLFP